MKGVIKSKRGDRKFSDEWEAVKFLVNEKKRLSLPDNVNLDEALPENKTNIYAFMNLKRAGEMTNRVNGTVLDLSNLPVLKRGRPPKEKNNE